MFPAERGTQAARRHAHRPRDKAADGAWLLVFFAVVMTLLALLAVLGVTSFPQVKRRMAAAFWTRLQKGAYVFFGLVYLRLVIVLLSSALAGGASRPQPASPCTRRRSLSTSFSASTKPCRTPAGKPPSPRKTDQDNPGLIGV